MSCNIGRYLEEKAMECFRMAHSTTEGTPSAAEWKLAAESISECSFNHMLRCQQCQLEKKIAQA